jgi:hypothetical protein
MLALGVLATAFFLLIQAHYGTLDLFDRAREQADEAALLQQIEGIARTEIAAGNFSGSGDFSKRLEDFSWSFEAQEAGEDYPGLLEVQMVLTRPDEEEVALNFLAFDDQPVSTGMGVGGGAAGGVDGMGGGGDFGGVGGGGFQ